jgi:hypothetical protein
MMQTAVLSTASSRSIVFMTFHLADDILLKMSPRGFSNLVATLILVVWPHGTVVLAELRARYIIRILGAACGLLVPVVHMKGANGLLGGEIGTSAMPCSSSGRFWHSARPRRSRPATCGDCHGAAPGGAPDRPPFH